MERYSTGEMHIPRGRRHCVNKKNFFIFVFLFAFMVFWVMFSIYALLLSLHRAYLLDMHTSFVGHANDHCGHFHMTVMCLIKLLICFTSCLLDCIFTCYIILVLLLLALFWGSNVFCVSVSGYRNICSKFITSFRFRCEWILPLFPNSSLRIEFVKGCFVTE